MKFELSNNKIFKDCFLTVGRIIDEIIIEADNDGLRCKALDKSHITFVNLEMDYDFFDSFECSTPEKLILDSNELMKILKRLKPSDRLICESDTSNFRLKYDGDSSRIFNLRLIDTDYDSPTPPSITHPVSVELPVDLLNDFLDDILLFDENIRFIVDQDYLHVECNGDTGDAECKYIHGLNVDDVYKSSFSIKSLKEMVGAKSLSKDCTLCLGNELPLMLRLESSVGDCRLEFLLAPRISDEG